MRLITVVYIAFFLSSSAAAIAQSVASSSQATDSRSVTKAGGTVIVGIAVAEGLVLVGDSRMTLQSPQWNPSYKIISDSHDKVMAVGNIGLATYGNDFILGRSTKSWIDDFAEALRKRKEPTPLTLDPFIAEFSKYFGDKFAEQLKQSPNIATGFLVAGYDSAGVGWIKKLDFPGGAIQKQFNTRKNFGMAFQGETDVIQRIILGIDFSRLGTVKPFASMDEAALKDARAQLASLEYNITYQALSLQDAVDLATFLVQATVTMQRFSFGTVGSVGSLPGVGGPVDTLTVTPSELKWVFKKQVIVH